MAAWNGRIRVGTRARCCKVTGMDEDYTSRDQTSTAGSGRVGRGMAPAACSMTKEIHSATTTAESGHTTASMAQACAATRAVQYTLASGPPV